MKSAGWQLLPGISRPASPALPCARWFWKAVKIVTNNEVLYLTHFKARIMGQGNGLPGQAAASRSAGVMRL